MDYEDYDRFDLLAEIETTIQGLKNKDLKKILHFLEEEFN